MSLTEETAWEDSVLDFIDAEAEALERDKAHAQAKERGWIDRLMDRIALNEQLRHGSTL